MHSLSRCKLCGKIFDPYSVPGRNGLCPKCCVRLEEIYSRVHEYIRRNKKDVVFEPEYLAEMTHTSLEDMNLLFSLGYLERDMQTWSDKISERRQLAGRFESAMARMKEERKLAMYGGTIYSRRSDD